MADGLKIQRGKDLWLLSCHPISAVDMQQEATMDGMDFKQRVHNYYPFPIQDVRSEGYSRKGLGDTTRPRDQEGREKCYDKWLVSMKNWGVSSCNLVWLQSTPYKVLAAIIMWIWRQRD